MKPLLLDHNLSPKLIQRLADLYPGSTHVYLLGLHTVNDRTVWDYAREYGYMVVTKDADYSELLLMYGYPPKIIWIRRGNCATQTIENYYATTLKRLKRCLMILKQASSHFFDEAEICTTCVIYSTSALNDRQRRRVELQPK